MTGLLHPPELGPALQGLLASLVEQSTNLVLLCNEAGDIRYINAAGIRMLGALNSEELLGVPIWEVQSTFDAQGWNRQMVERLMLTGKWEGDLTFRHRRNTRTMLTECQALLMQLEGETTTNLISLTARDLTLDRLWDHEMQTLARLSGENPNPVIRLRPDGVVLYANTASRELLEAMNSEIGDPLPEKLAQPIIQAYTNNQMLGLEVSCADRVLMLTAAPFPREGYVNIYGTDITTLKQMEDELRTSEARYRLLALHSPNGIAVHLENTLIYANAAAARILGANNHNDLLGRSIMDFIQPDDRGALEAMFAKSVLSGESQGVVETGFIRADGGYGIMEIACIPFAHLGRRAVQTVFQDITDRKSAEQLITMRNRELAEVNEELVSVNVSLHDEATRLELILRGIGDGVIAIDLDERVILMNMVARDLLGIGAVQTDDLKLADLFVACRTRRETVRDANEPQDEGTQEYVLEVLKPVPRMLKVRRSTYIDESARPAGSVLILHDMTREFEIDRMKTDFVSSVSHELRTPLTSIKGAASTVLDDREMPPAIQSRFMAIINEETDRLTQLIEDLLQISRIESGHVDLRLTSIKLDDLIRSTLVNLRAGIPNRQLDFELELDEDLPHPVGDRDAVQRILINVIGNAIKFTLDEGCVTIRTRNEDGRWAVIEIEDTGMGIPARDLEHIFQRFYRVARPGMEIQGTGLGLSIVYDLVKLMQGEVEVQSQLRRGTRFTIRLPFCHRSGEAEICEI